MLTLQHHPWRIQQAEDSSSIHGTMRREEATRLLMHAAYSSYQWQFFQWRSGKSQEFKGLIHTRLA